MLGTVIGSGMVVALDLWGESGLALEPAMSFIKHFTPVIYDRKNWLWWPQRLRLEFKKFVLKIRVLLQL
jgi:hypothetical protein